MSQDSFSYPHPVDADMVGEYPAVAKAGAGYFYDEVLEYRVWCYPRRGADDLLDGEDYYYAFSSYEEALEFTNETTGAQEPLALVRQRQWINEVRPGEYQHEKGERIAEWPATCLEGRKRDSSSIDKFFADRTL